MIANLAYAKESTPEPLPSNVQLKLVESVGELPPKKNQWVNRLVAGDNLSVLSAMMQDSAIRGKVRLVYIDPPFATGQLFNGKHSK